MNAPMLEQYWTTKQVAERLQVSADAVKKWLGAGKLRRTKIGGTTRVTETDLQDYIRRCTDRASRAA